MKPQLENAFSRAGILYGHLVEGVKTGTISMWMEGGNIVYSWNLRIDGLPCGVTSSVAIEDLCKYGVSMLERATKILHEWRGMFNDSRSST